MTLPTNGITQDVVRDLMPLPPQPKPPRRQLRLHPTSPDATTARHHTPPNPNSTFPRINPMNPEPAARFTRPPPAHPARFIEPSYWRNRTATRRR
jgi:hypothetical protein